MKTKAGQLDNFAPSNVRSAAAVPVEGWNRSETDVRNELDFLSNGTSIEAVHGKVSAVAIRETFEHIFLNDLIFMESWNDLLLYRSMRSFFTQVGA
jgi:hypothetical protein